jgi:integrase
MYINPRIGPIRLSALTGDDIEAVLAQMRTDGLSVASRGTCYRTIRAMLREAQKRGRLTTDPLATVLPPSAADRSRMPAERPTDDEWSQPGDVRIHPRERPSRALTNQSVRALLEAAQQDPDALARWAIAVLCGLRQGEALGLQWGRLNWDQGTLRIDRQLRRVRARHGCGDPTPEPDQRRKSRPSQCQKKAHHDGAGYSSGTGHAGSGVPATAQPGSASRDWPWCRSRRPSPNGPSRWPRLSWKPCAHG